MEMTVEPYINFTPKELENNTGEDNDCSEDSNIIKYDFSGGVDCEKNFDIKEGCAWRLVVLAYWHMGF